MTIIARIAASLSLRELQQARHCVNRSKLVIARSAATRQSIKTNKAALCFSAKLRAAFFFNLGVMVASLQSGVRQAFLDSLPLSTLKRFGIPYRYEYPMRLKNGITVHPDFLCLNVRTRQEFYWEHFGMMTTPDYAQKAIHKIQQYSDNHLLPGINLIITMETATSTLNLRYIEQQIKTYLT